MVKIGFVNTEYAYDELMRWRAKKSHNVWLRRLDRLRWADDVYPYIAACLARNGNTCASPSELEEPGLIIDGTGFFAGVNYLHYGIGMELDTNEIFDKPKFLSKPKAEHFVGEKLNGLEARLRIKKLSAFGAKIMRSQGLSDSKVGYEISINYDKGVLHHPHLFRGMEQFNQQLVEMAKRAEAAIDEIYKRAGYQSPNVLLLYANEWSYSRGTAAIEEVDGRPIVTLTEEKKRPRADNVVSIHDFRSK